MEQLNIFNVLHEKFKIDNTNGVRLFEAFAGYGAFHMAMKRLGWKVDLVGYSEIDKYAIKVYEQLHNAYGKNYGAIGSFERLPNDIDICTWSFPCQDISLAGKQRGMVDGSRSNYGFVFLDTVLNTPYEERPKVLIMENVRALFSEKFRDDWREIQSRLDSIGYTSYSEILNAKDYGVAQNRERVFIVSILGGGFYEFPKPYELTKRLKDYLEDEVNEKYYLSENLIKSMLKNSSEKFDRKSKFTDGITDGDKIARTITTHVVRPESNYIKVKTNNDESLVYKTKEADMPRHRIYDVESVGFTITTNESQQPSILIPEATQKGYAEAHDGDGVYINRPHQKRGVVQKGMIQTIKTQCDDIGIVVYDGYNGKVREDQDTIGTITTNIGIDSMRNGQKIINNLTIRKLTPREALRLMDVDEKDIDIILSLVSETQAYKLAGNSIVVNVLVEMFKEMIK